MVLRCNSNYYTFSVSQFYGDEIIVRQVAEVSGNTASWSDVQFKATKASCVRITINDAGSDNVARISDVDIYGVAN